MGPIRTLRQCLVDTELAHLRVMARVWGHELHATRPVEMAAELADALADPSNAAEVWEALPADQREALNALLTAGGQAPIAAFERRFGHIRPMGPGRLEQEAPWREPVSPVEGLWYRGLIYKGFAGQAGETYPVYFVPVELQAALPADAMAATAQIVVKAASPPDDYRFSGDLFLDDITTALAFVHNTDVRPPAETVWRWPEKARRALAATLRDPDPERLDFILHLLGASGWLRLDEDGRLRLIAEPVTAWLQADAGESRAALVRAWREMTAWNELWRLPSLRPDDTGTWRNDPTLARAAMLRHLGALPPGEWVALGDFVAAIKNADPDFQRPGGDYDTWYIRDAASGEYLHGFESWDQVEGALLRALLTGPAFWLGLVALSAQGDLFRAVPGAPATAEAPPPAVRADLTVEMPAGRRFHRFQLARVADLVSAGERYVYRFTAASLSRARRQRISLARIFAFLDELSPAPLPEPVRACLTRWFQHGTQVWLERAVVLRVSGEEVLEQILAAPQSRRYLQRVIGPTAATVAEKDWPQLVAALAELGLLAELEELPDRD